MKKYLSLNTAIFVVLTLLVITLGWRALTYKEEPAATVQEEEQGLPDTTLTTTEPRGAEPDVSEGTAPKPAETKNPTVASNTPKTPSTSGSAQATNPATGSTVSAPQHAIQTQSTTASQATTQTQTTQTTTQPQQTQQPVQQTVAQSTAQTVTPRPSSGFNLGIQLDGHAYWSPLGSHCDATTLFSPWMQPGTTDYGKTGIYVTAPSKLTGDNYPLVDADSISLLLGYDSGPYNVSFEGAGTLTLAGKSDWQKSGSVSSGTVNLKSGDVTILQLRNIDQNNPIKNLKIIPANESECVGGKTYRNKFLSKLEPFTTLRFMDWMQTNDSPLVHWSDRPKAGSFGHTRVEAGTPTVGIAYEDIVELANITGKDIWINVPHKASDDFMKNFAQFFKNNLHGNSKIYVEYSNETWNSIFSQHAYVRAKGHAESPWPTRSDIEVSGYYNGMQAKKVADAFKQVFGDAAFASRVYPVIGSNIVANYWPYYGLSAIDELYKNETNVTAGSYHNIRAIAVNPYLGSDQLDHVTGGDIFEKLKNVALVKNAAWLKAMKDTNAQFGINLPYVAYESGQHLVGKSYQGQSYHATVNDPRMADVYRTLYGWWNETNPGQLAVHFAFVSKQDTDYYWGLFENMNQTTSVRYKALMDLAGR